MSDTLLNLFALTVAITIGMVFAVLFYESLCFRDVVVRRVMEIANRRSRRRLVRAIAYALSVGVAIPILLIVWANVLEAGLLVIGSAARLGNLALISVAIVAAARVLAYIREQMSHELAKAIPLSFIFVLLTGGSINFQANVDLLLTQPDLTNVTPEMTVFLIVVELGLRGMTDASHWALARMRARRGIDSDLGVWRTLAAVARRPIDGPDAPEVI